MNKAAAEAFLAERQAFRRTLEDVGPDAPSLIERWDAADIAAHVLGGEDLAGVPVFVARLLVNRGVDFRGFNKSRAIERSTERQRERLKASGFDAMLQRLREPPPRLFLRPVITPISLFEVWAHHEDVRRANGRGPDRERDYPALRDCIPFLARYVGKGLADTTVIIDPGSESMTVGSGTQRIVLRGPIGEAVLWLAGRAAVARLEVEGEMARAIAERLDV